MKYQGGYGEMKKKICVCITAVVLSAVMTGTAFAGTWSSQKKSTDSGAEYTEWSYRKDNGSKVAGEWIQDKGTWYYIGSDGIMLSDDISPDGYAVGDTGAWVASIPRITMTNEMKAAYKGVVAEAQQNNTAKYASTYDKIYYTIHDMNHDGIPELLVHDGDCEAAYRYIVYTFDGAEAVRVGEFGAAHAADLLESDAEGNLYFAAAHMGSYGVSRITYDGNTVADTYLDETRPDGLKDEYGMDDYDKTAAYYNNLLGIVYRLPNVDYNNTRLLDIR